MARNTSFFLLYVKHWIFYAMFCTKVHSQNNLFENNTKTKMVEIIYVEKKEKIKKS